MKTVNYNKMYKLYEETIKNLDRLFFMAQEAQYGALKLDDKLQMARLQKVCESARREMFIHRFDAEDAQKFRNLWIKKGEKG